MRQWSLVPLVLLPMLAWRGEAAAEASGVPVHVSVRGSGTIKVRIAAGVAAPCDASSNAMLFDGELRANDGLELRASGWSVCVQHTFGGFERTGWSTPVIVTPRCLRWVGRRCAESEGAIRVDLSTEAPFSRR